MHRCAVAITMHRFVHSEWGQAGAEWWRNAETHYVMHVTATRALLPGGVGSVCTARPVRGREPRRDTHCRRPLSTNLCLVSVTGYMVRQMAQAHAQWPNCAALD